MTRVRNFFEALNAARRFFKLFRLIQRGERVVVQPLVTALPPPADRWAPIQVEERRPERLLPERN